MTKTTIRLTETDIWLTKTNVGLTKTPILTRLHSRIYAIDHRPPVCTCDYWSPKLCWVRPTEPGLRASKATVRGPKTGLLCAKATLIRTKCRLNSTKWRRLVETGSSTKSRHLANRIGLLTKSCCVSTKRWWHGPKSVGGRLIELILSSSIHFYSLKISLYIHNNINIGALFKLLLNFNINNKQYKDKQSL